MEQTQRMGVPESHLGGHAFHTYRSALLLRLHEGIQKLPAQQVRWCCRACMQTDVTGRGRGVCVPAQRVRQDHLR